MKKQRTGHTFHLLLSLIFLINSGTSVGYAATAQQAAKGSRKIKRVDTLTLQPQVLANSLGQVQSSSGSVGLVLPQPVVSQSVPSGSGVALPPATVPLLAIAILGLMASQSSGLFSGSNNTDTSTPLAFNDFGSAPDSSGDCPPSATSSQEPMIDESAPDVSANEESSSSDSFSPSATTPIEDTPVAETVAEQAAQEAAEEISKAEVPPTPTQKADANSVNQCFDYRAAGKDLGKSAGVVSIGDSACNAEVIAMDYIITNSHCTEGTRGSTRAVFGLGKGQSKRAFNCQTIQARSPKNSLDYAIIKCPGIGKQFPPVDIANRRPKSGEAIRIATHNFRGESIRKLTNSGKVLPQGNLLGPAMMTSAYGEPGNSGSGIYDREGKWLGILWGGVHDDGGKPTYFTPADEIIKHLNAQYPKVASQIKSDFSMVASCQTTASQDRVPAQTKTGVQ